jgi:NAD-dependent deacetylase
VACIACGKEWPPEVIHLRVAEGDEAPECDACGAPLKSKTISFGQAMPERAMREAAELMAESDCCLVVGSSLVVEPAASLPRVAKHHGATLIILNHSDTPLDFSADLVVRAAIGETMRAVLDRIDAGWADLRGREDSAGSPGAARCGTDG